MIITAQCNMTCRFSGFSSHASLTHVLLPSPAWANATVLICVCVGSWQQLLYSSILVPSDAFCGTVCGVKSVRSQPLAILPIVTHPSHAMHMCLGKGSQQLL